MGDCDLREKSTDPPSNNTAPMTTTVVTRRDRRVNLEPTFATVQHSIRDCVYTWELI